MRTPAVLGTTAFDKIFEQFFHNPQPLIRRSTEGYPVTDLYHDESGGQVIEMALAGFDEEDLCIEIQDNKITISARSEKPPDLHQRRIAKRSFSKTFVDYRNTLDLQRAKATFINGLLSVKIPQLVESTPTIIKIN